MEGYVHNTISMIVIVRFTFSNMVVHYLRFLFLLLWFLLSRIIDVIISGPLNSTKYETTTGEYVINWTPTAENYGQHFPFCFIAEGQYGYILLSECTF